MSVWQNAKWDDCQLSVRTINVWKNSWPDKTLGDLAKISDDQLMRAHNFGRLSLNELRACIKECQETWLPNHMPDEVAFWAERHRTLILALMRGEAKIVPI